MSVSESEMTCRELVELVTDYIEGTLPPAERVRFDAHLGDCPYCRTYLQQMRRTIAMLGGLSEGSIDPRASEDLLSRFRDWKRQSGSPGHTSGSRF